MKISTINGFTDFLTNLEIQITNNGTYNEYFNGSVICALENKEDNLYFKDYKEFKQTYKRCLLEMYRLDFIGYGLIIPSGIIFYFATKQIN